MPKLEGQALHPDLLDGEGRAFWLQLSSEIQMSLHNCVVNEARVQAGKWPINSVWFWGNGPARSIACAWQQVIAQSPMPEWLGVEIQQRLIRAPVVADIAALGPGAHLWCVGQTQALPDADDITLLDQLVQRLNAGKLSAIHCWVPQLGHVALQAPKQRWWWPF